MMMSPSVFIGLFGIIFLHKSTKKNSFFQASATMNFPLHAIIPKWSFYEL